MRTARSLFLPLCLIFILGVSCGKKADPIPKSSLKLRPPTNISLTVVIDGIKIDNRDDNATLYVEKALMDDAMLPLSRYERVILIKPKGSFVDKTVVKNQFYNYRFANYYPELRTYSPAVVRGVRFVIQKSLGNVDIEVASNSLCVTAQLSDDVDHANLNVNGRFIAALDGERFCTSMPPTATIDIFIVPYDTDGNAGIPYMKKIEIDQDSVLLPPQNIKVFSGSNRLSLSWDAVKNVDHYLIYKVDEKQNTKLLEKTNATLYSYMLLENEGDKCIDFQLLSVRAGIKSVAVKISACK